VISVVIVEPTQLLWLIWGGYCCASTSTIYNTGNPVADKAACQAACTVHTDMASCDGICKGVVCDTKPECCVKADLRVGTTQEDMNYKELEVDINQPVFVDARTYSKNCRNLTSGISAYGLDNSGIVNLSIAPELLLFDYSCTSFPVLALNPCGLTSFLQGASCVSPPPLNSFCWASIASFPSCGYTQTAFSNPGYYTIKLKIYDENCKGSKWDEVKINVHNP